MYILFSKVEDFLEELRSSTSDGPVRVTFVYKSNRALPMLTSCFLCGGYKNNDGDLVEVVDFLGDQMVGHDHEEAKRRTAKKDDLIRIVRNFGKEVKQGRFQLAQEYP